MMKKYGGNLNRNLGRMNNTSQQIESGRRFKKASEDPVRALKALQVRRNLSALNQYTMNIDTADSWLTQTEVVVSAIKSHADKAVDLILQGRNDTMAAEDRKIIATSLKNVQEALLKDLNSQVAGRYLMGGANTKEVPFRVHQGAEDPFDPDPEQAGQLLFNTENVFQIRLPESSIGFTTYGEGDFESLESKVYVDLTGEFQLNEFGELIDKSTVFDMFTPGVAAIGVGPNNLYNLIGRIIFAFESEYQQKDVTIENALNPITGDYSDLEFRVYSGTIRMHDIDGPIMDELDYLLDIVNDPTVSQEERDRAQYEYNLFGGESYLGGSGLFQRLQEAQLNALISLVNVGERCNFVNYLKERNEEYVFQAEVLQNKLEGIPPDEAIMHFKMQDYVYKACLQMGTYIFQPTLMDYIKR